LVGYADRLVTEVMRERGYPISDFDQRASDISVDHPGTVGSDSLSTTGVATLGHAATLESDGHGQHNGAFAIDPVNTATGLDNRKLGMWLFLVTEVMLFSALIGAMMQMKARSPATANDILNVPLTAVNTFVLIVSSTTVVLALEAIMKGDKRKLKWLLAATLALGSIFLGVQVYEYTQLLHEDFTPWGSLFGAGFYTVTGFHGFHVFIGICLCATLLFRAVKERFSPDNYMPIEIFGLYWHFVDIVWIILFTIIYLI
jgi:heme/copper-type cytochrome/quinol oxidase subunit 3